MPFLDFIDAFKNRTKKKHGYLSNETSKKEVKAYVSTRYTYMYIQKETVQYKRHKNAF